MRSNYRQRIATKIYNNAKKDSTLKDAVRDILLNEDATFNRHGIPKSTLKYLAINFKSVSGLLDILFGDVTREQYFSATSKRPPPPPLISMDDVTFLLKKIISRDNNNNRTSQDYVVNMIMELSKNYNQKKW